MILWETWIFHCTVDPANDSKLTKYFGQNQGSYSFRSWSSPWGGNASIQVVDTHMLGTVTVEIQPATVSILIQGTNIVAGTQTANNTTKSGVSRTQIGAGRIAVLAPENADFTVTYLKLRCVGYHMLLDLFYFQIMKALVNHEMH